MERTMLNCSVSPARSQVPRYASRYALARLALLAVVLLHSFMGATALTLPTELANMEANQPADGDVVAKRNWQSLQGAWGKRSVGAGISAEITEADDDVYFAERRVPLPFSVGDNPNPVLKYSLVYLKNGGGMLDHLMNSEDEPMLDSRNVDGLRSAQYDTDMDNLDAVDNAISNEKRAWKSMNVAWGKRRNAPQWNKFRGAWGKREPGWNNLKGMWGKRGAKDWQKLHGSWGKRSTQNTLGTN